ncbi:MAG: FKBP-type peptidyl-prolyl cis-trans isomerase SlyD [Cellvibrionaceae bacterium]|jgi:FKBP-type peptidyl-prolyl cis-trans isomerase SlyD
MNSSLQITNNMVISINYSLTLDSGEEIDRSELGEPLVYLHGHSNIIPGLEDRLVTLKVGDEKEVIVKPEDAYGEYDEDGFFAMERTLFPDDFEIEEGMLLHLKDDESNEETEAFVHEIGDEEIILDKNHPLAGETLCFKVEIVDIRSATAVEIEHGHVHLEHDHG